MRVVITLLALLLAVPLSAQTSTAPDPWQPLTFLEGTWEAKTAAGGTVKSSGTYTFKTELAGHILARHSSSNGDCKGPADFNCDHSDLLYIFEDAPGQPLRAIYFDNEGHVIHYDVSTPNPTTVVFLSEASQPGPQFQLVYELKDGTMFGKFQMRMPGQNDWRSYLEWSGNKHA
jgi:hypothetical protein